MIKERITSAIVAVRRPPICMLLLTPLFTAAYYAAFLLRFEGRIDAEHAGLFWQTAVWVTGIKILVLGWYRVHFGWGRLVTFHDMLTVARAVTVSSLLIVLFDFIALPRQAIPRSVVFLDWGAMMVALCAARGVLRYFQDHGRLVEFATDRKPVLIVGANDSGESLLRILRRNRRLNYAVVGFIDNDSTLVGNRIDGIPVVGTLDRTCELAVEYGVDEVLITAGELSGRHVRQLVESSQNHDFRVQVLPSYEQLLRGSVDLQPRQVNINDLLRREPVRLELRRICEWLDGRTLMVTGSSGSIGSEICRQLIALSPRRIVLVDRSENGQFFLQRELQELAPAAEIIVCVADITDRSRMETLFEQYRPEIVFHAAAYKHVPLMEANPGEAVKNIVLASRQLADLADHYGVQSFVMISTDKAVNPTSVMGACKRVAEQYVQSLAATSSCRFVTVRFGNVLDSAGSVVPIFRQQIARGGPITITHPDIERFFMTIPEASQLVVQAGAMGQGGEIFVLDMGEPVRIIDLARDMIRLSGLTVDEDIEIAITGLRPGEKLFEELYNRHEEHVETPHEKIMVAAGTARSDMSIRLAVKRLEDCADSPVAVVTNCLQEVLPEYGATRAAETIRIQKAA